MAITGITDVQKEFSSGFNYLFIVLDIIIILHLFDIYINQRQLKNLQVPLLSRLN